MNRNVIPQKVLPAGQHLSTNPGRYATPLTELLVEQAFSEPHALNGISFSWQENRVASQFSSDTLSALNSNDERAMRAIAKRYGVDTSTSYWTGELRLAVRADYLSAQSLLSKSYNREHGSESVLREVQRLIENKVETDIADRVDLILKQEYSSLHAVKDLLHKLMPPEGLQIPNESQTHSIPSPNSLTDLFFDSVNLNDGADFHELEFSAEECALLTKAIQVMTSALELNDIDALKQIAKIRYGIAPDSAGWLQVFERAAYHDLKGLEKESGYLLERVRGAASTVRSTVRVFADRVHADLRVELETFISEGSEQLERAKQFNSIVQASRKAIAERIAAQGPAG